MSLNPDLYADLFFELIYLTDANLEFLSKFILSGKESLMGVRQTMKTVDIIRLSYGSLDPTNVALPLFCYNIQFTEEITISIGAKYGLNFPMLIMQWALSSGRTVMLDSKKTFPKRITNYLLQNPNLKRLILKEYDLSIVKQLLKSRRFDYVMIFRDLFRRSNDLCIDTEVLEFAHVSLKDIFKSRFIKTKKLICRDVFDMFIDGPIVNVNPNFQSLEELEVNLHQVHLCCASRITMHSQTILDLFKSLNTGLPNLKYFDFEFDEYFPYFSRSFNGESNMHADDFNDILRYEDKLIGCNGKAKVQFNHTLVCDMIPNFDQTAKEYVDELKENLPSFEYSSWNEGDNTVYEFSKSRNITENFEMNLNIRLTRNN